MNNIATALKTSPAPVVAVDPATMPGVTAVGAASDDFILALTQALAFVAPATVAVAVAPSVAAEAEPEELSAEQAASSLAAMLTLPWVPQIVAPPPGAKVDSLEMLGVTGAGAQAGPQQSMVDAALQSTFTSPGSTGVDAGLMFNPALDRPASTPAAEVAAASRPMPANVGSSSWPEELGVRLTLMAERGQHTASLRLSPEHLGPLEIRIAIRDDQASVWFGAAHADTRAAIEHALPRLREMFAAQGLSLTDAGVFREPPRERSAVPQQSALAAELGNETPVTMITLQRMGLIDAYA